MKKASIVFSSLIFLLLLIISTSPVKAVPPIPSSFFGEVHFESGDFTPISGTTIVEAYVDGGGTSVASATITTFGSDLVYSINVPGNDEDPQPSTIQFKIEGRLVATANWVSGTNVNLDLHPPFPDAGGPYVGVVGEDVQLNGSATDWGSDVSSYAWDFDDDGIYDDSSIASPLESFSAGVNPVALKVIDGQGGEGFDETDVIFVALGGLNGQVYDGDPKSITVTDVSPYSTVVSYDGSLTAPTNAGTYPVVVEVKDGATIIGTISGYNLVIDKRAITVTAVTDTKEYDGDTSSAGVPTITVGSLATGDTAVWSQTFNNKNVGTGKTLTPMGTITDENSGNNYAVTYVNDITGSITARPITVTAVTDTKEYNGDTTSVGVPIITTGSLATGDTAVWSQIFDNKNVGTGKTLTPTGTITDGNGGINYAVTYVNDTTGVIASRPITVTAVKDTKEYDGDTASVGIPTITTGSLATGDTAVWSQTFDNKNVGTGKTLTPTGTINDGNGGNNYAVTYVNDTTGSITPRPITVTADAKSKVYGASDPSLTYTFTGTLVIGDTFSGSLSREDGEDIGTYAILQNTLTLGPNYDITFNSAVFTINPVQHLIDLDIGWNLVSFNLHPVSTDVADVLSSISGKFDLVYGWDATGAHAGSGNWMKYDDQPSTTDTLTTLDEKMGFWIHMMEADTLTINGSFETATSIDLLDDVGGWNLVGFPASAAADLPGILEDKGVASGVYSLVYSYDASDSIDPWKLYDPLGPSYSNDLVNLSPGLGFWIYVTEDATWMVNF